MITIVKNLTLGKFYPSANGINTTISSNNSGRCNFRYIADLYINNIKVFSEKLFPDPKTGWGFFQLNRVIEDYIKTYEVDPNSKSIDLGASLVAPSAALSVFVKFGEEYDLSLDCSGTVIQYTNLATSNIFYVYQSAFDYEDYPTYDDSKFIVEATGVTSSISFLTNVPSREADVTFNDPYYLDFISNDIVNGSWKVNLELTTINGVLSTYIPVSFLSKVRRYRLSVGPYNINRIFEYPLINLGTISYKVWLTWNDIKKTEVFTFRVKSPGEFGTRFGFTGLLGAPESFTFYHRKRKSYNIERANTQRILGRNISGDWKYNVGDRTETTYKVLANEVLSVSTFCDKSNSEWLYEMWLSPNVWEYKKPELDSITIWTAPNPVLSTPVLLLVNDVSKYSPGDFIMVIPEGIVGYSSFIGRYEILDIIGSGLDIGATWGSFSPPKNMCGFIYKDEEFQKLPITISDNTIEVKQRLGRPIEYGLNFRRAYQKTTLRG